MSDASFNYAAGILSGAQRSRRSLPLRSSLNIL